MNLLFWDTETTGLPDWQQPSDAPHQPHLVQLAALLVDSESREIIDSMDVLVKPNGWEWDENNEAFKIHGITVERAMADGIPEEEALDRFLALYRRCELRVAHNSTFDNRILRCALKRYRPDLIPDEEWKDRERYYCTLMNAKRVMGGNKGRTLQECCDFFGVELKDAHSAMGDAQACMRIYFHIKEMEAMAA